MAKIVGKKSLGQRIGMGIGGAFAGLADFMGKREQYQQQADAAKLKRDQMENEYELAQAQVQTKKTSMTSDFLLKLADSPMSLRPKLLDSMRPFFSEMGVELGDVFNKDDTSEYLRQIGLASNPLTVQHTDENKFSIALGGLSPASQKVFSELFAKNKQEYRLRENTKNALGNYRLSSGGSLETPEDLTAASKLGVEPTGKVVDGKTELGVGPFAPNRSGESGLLKAVGTEQGKSFAKALDARPNVAARIENLNTALSLIDKVSTGPLKGRDALFEVQKLFNDNAIAIDMFLSKENVELIMQFAKEAGVRSIDTEQEQQRLLKAIANKQMTPEILKKALVSMRATAEEAMMIVDEKQKYLSDGNDSLIQYRPSTLDQKAYVNPQGDIVRVNKGDKAPEGYVTLKEMWNNEKFWSPAKTSGPKSLVKDEDLDALDAEFLK